jgi:hypothetical protein
MSAGGGENEWLPENVQGAIALHEVYKAYVRGGFTRSQALHIAVAVLLDGIRYRRDAGE